MEGFLRGDRQKEQIFADNSTARPTTSSAMTTQQQRLPVQPEEPTGVVLPPSLPPAPVECVDVHEKSVNSRIHLIINKIIIISIRIIFIKNRKYLKKKFSL